MNGAPEKPEQVSVAKWWIKNVVVPILGSGGVLAILLTAYIYSTDPDPSGESASSIDPIDECTQSNPNQKYNCVLSYFLDSLPSDTVTIFPNAGNTCTSNPQHTNLEKKVAQSISIGGRNCQLQATRSTDQSSDRVDVIIHVNKLVPTKSCDQGLPTIALKGTNAIEIGGNATKTYLGEFRINFNTTENRDLSLGKLKQLISLCTSS